MSNLKHEETEIDGIKFSTTQYGAMRGLELLGKLAKTVGPAMGALSSAETGTDIEKFAPVIAVALRDLQPNELVSLSVDILSGTSATITDNNTMRRVDLVNRDALDKVFSGRLTTMFKVLLHALKVNFSDFGFGSAAPSESAPKAE